MSTVSQDIMNGVALTDDEIKEMVEMYRSNKYYMYEIYEWFGITRTKFKTYLKHYDRRTQNNE